MGSIYKISNTENDFIYIGKTTKTIAERFHEHQVSYGGWCYRGFRKEYCSSFEVLKFKGYKIELLELVESDLASCEKFHINNEIHPVVNIQFNKRKGNFICSCGKTINSDYFHKHCRSSIHRTALKLLHSVSTNRLNFISMYKSSIGITSSPSERNVDKGITITI